MVKVNGNLIHDTIKLFKEKYGENVYKEVYKKLNSYSKEIMSEVIISGQMYDMDVFNDLQKCMVAVLGEKEFSKFCELIADKQIYFWGFFMRLISIEKILPKIAGIWEKSYDSGAITKAEIKGNIISVVISDFKISDPHLLAMKHYFKRCVENVTKKTAIPKVRRIDELNTEYIYEIQSK